MADINTRELNPYFPYAGHRYYLTMEAFHAVETQLGLDPSTPGPVGPIWDRIATATGQPTTADLKRGMETPGIDVLPSIIWNRAVDTAFGTNHPAHLDRTQ